MAHARPIPSLRKPRATRQRARRTPRGRPCGREGVPLVPMCTLASPFPSPRHSTTHNSATRD